MLKWLLTLILAVLIIGAFTPWLRKLGISQQHARRRIPGDFEVERRGKRFSFPIGSTILLSMLASLIFWLLR
ncbi:MAG: DUF2905 family protein [Burkholderiales bacterium]|nr:DUF2905 family protein [Burkholderiales bacterium]